MNPITPLASEPAGGYQEAAIRTGGSSMRSERQVLFWLAALILAAVAILVLKDVLLPFVVGLVIAYALNPLTERLVKAGLSRLLACALVVAMLVAIVALASRRDSPAFTSRSVSGLRA